MVTPEDLGVGTPVGFGLAHLIASSAWMKSPSSNRSGAVWVGT